MRVLAIALVVPLFAAAASTAFATDPSVDDLINSLRPASGQLKGTTRGIRPPLVTPGAQPTQELRKASYVQHGSAPAAETALPTSDMAVAFVSGSAQLTPLAERTLDVLGKALTSPALEKCRFRIEGHTDTVGSPDANRDLSTRRAKSVTDYLETKFGIDAARMDAVGLGDSHLLVSTPPQTDEPRNRRVRIVNLDG